jgi:tRNA(His) guanylyltransferase
MSNSKFEYVKSFENKNDLLKNTYIVIRIDGKGFTKFTDAHQYKKPNEIKGIKIMALAGLSVMESFPEIFLGYGQSDEFSFAFKKNARLYNRRHEKILTNVVSQFTSAFVYYWPKVFVNGPELKYPPCFDGRVVLYPSFQNLKDYFSWRYVDCHINDLYNTTFWALVQEGKMTKDEAHKKLKGTLSNDKNEILFSQFNINYNNQPEVYKKGTLVIRVKKIISQRPPKVGEKEAINEEDKKKIEEINKANEEFLDKCNKAFKTDELLTKDDKFMEEKLNGLKGQIYLAHLDVVKDSFWNKELIDYE